jgi:hypothetical protein
MFHVPDARNARTGRTVRILKSLFWMVLSLLPSSSVAETVRRFDAEDFHHYDPQDEFENSTNRRILLHLRGGKDPQVGDGASTQYRPPSARKSLSLAPPAGNVSIPLHAHMGTHHVHVYIGSPPQRQTLIVDTGSRLMAFGCRPCRSCGDHASPYFDPTLSTTKRIPTCGHCQLSGISTCSLYNDQCVMTQKYTEGSSWNAHEVQDLIWLGTPLVEESIESYMGQLAVPYTFGCQTGAKGLFRKQYADGILGLARHDDTSLVTAMYHAQAIPRNAFSLCLTRTGGHLTLGGPLSLSLVRQPETNDPHLLEFMRLTPITREHGWYSIQLVKLQVGDITIAMDYEYYNNEHNGTTTTTITTAEIKEEESSVKQSVKQLSHVMKVLNRGKGVILDSGTTDTYLPSLLDQSFSQAVSVLTNGMTGLLSNKERSRSYTYEEFQQLPDITFVFANDVTIVMSPISYMEGAPPQLDQRHLHPSLQQQQVAEGNGDRQQDPAVWHSQPQHDTSTTTQEQEYHGQQEDIPWQGTKTLTCRIYCTESEGAVLGANAMFGYDILFDAQGHQVGIAKANCE